MMNKFLEDIHLLVHSVRLLPNYKPTNFEKAVSKRVIEEFKDSCKECKEVDDRNKLPKKTFINKLGDSLSRV